LTGRSIYSATCIPYQNITCSSSSHRSEYRAAQIQLRMCAQVISLILYSIKETVKDS